MDLVAFSDKQIRRKWNNDEEKWYFSVIDIVEVLSDSTEPRRYWSDLKIKLKSEGSEVYDKIVQLKLVSPDGKLRETDVADTENVFRIIQSIPSPKAEPFKLWLAQVGYERVEEVSDPEITINRALKMYLRQGRTPEWVNLRLKSIEIRKDLTEEWENRGVKEGKDFAILTDDITLAWAGIKTKNYKNLKYLKKENLRDNMTNLELVLNMLAESSTTAISQKDQPETFVQNRQVAKKGGRVAGVARIELEKRLGQSVISKQKFIPTQKKLK